MKYLSEFHGRDNNFNLIRMIAALLVIEAHACSMSGRGDLLKPLFGIGGGDIGVDVFFVLSGYLIAKSWTGKTWREFAWARVMRIYPALWVSTALSVLIVGICFSRPGFFDLTSTWGYLWHNVTMLPHFSAQIDLPGAFATSGHNFNLSLWTLPFELQMYLTLAVVGSILGLRWPYMLVLAIIGAALAMTSEADRGRLVYFFFSGAFSFTLRERILLDGRIALLLAVTAVVSLFTPAREATISLALPYLVLWCAYVPGGPLRLWNRLGDYSYGSYIFAHPIQMGLAVYGITAVWWSNMLLSIAIILPLAALSWHALEKRALAIPLIHSRHTALGV
ncbi:MAG TPA: acyltransferase [Steroidobacteraceae bacterium]|nr:acyltransferase [Steroidobacteraceae bacterium]